MWWRGDVPTRDTRSGTLAGSRWRAPGPTGAAASRTPGCCEREKCCQKYYHQINLQKDPNIKQVWRRYAGSSVCNNLKLTNIFLILEKFYPGHSSEAQFCSTWVHVCCFGFQFRLVRMHITPTWVNFSLIWVNINLIWVYVGLFWAAKLGLLQGLSPIEYSFAVQRVTIINRLDFYKK